MSDPSGNNENLTLDDQIDDNEEDQDQVIEESDEDEDWEELSNPGESDETRFIRKCLEKKDRDDLDPVPASMKELYNVTEINLGGGIIRMIPDCIIELKAVKELNLFGNPLETRISGNLWKLTTLIDLDFLYCQLTSLPDAIGNLINLERLEVQDNALTSLPNTLWNLRRMKTLYLSGNQLTEIPDTLGENLLDLEVLHLSDNNLESIPQSFENLKKLRSLDLDDNQLTEIPDTLGENLLDLEFLHLSDNNLESIPQSFENLKKLRSLGLDGNSLTTLPNIFEKMTAMRSEGANLYIYDISTMTSLPDSIRLVKNTLKNSYGSMKEHAPLLALVDLKYQRWCDRKPLLLMKPKKGVDLKKYAAMYEVLLARLDARYGDPARSFTLVQHIGSFLGPIPNHVTQEAIVAYRK